jgi:hypothetical protein
MTQAAAWMTAANLALARTLWDAGVDCAEIARRVRTSRDALLGYAHRRNWPPHPNGALGSAGGKRKPERSHHKGGAPRPARKPKSASLVACQPARLALPTATFQTCQWVMHERPLRFCDAPATRGAWCEDHRRVVYQHRSTLVAA